MKRFRFPFVVMVGFAVAYGIAWFVVREKFRQVHPPAQPSAAERGTTSDQIRELIGMNTDLVRGTAKLSRIIPQISPQEAGDILVELYRRADSCPPIGNQAFTLLEYRSEQSPGRSSRKEDGAFPVLVFDYSHPFPDSADSTPDFTGSFGFSGWNADSSRRTPMSAVHWALLWMERRDSAAALAFFTELGPAWQESATRWLCDFVGNKTLAEAIPWLEHIAPPSVRSRVVEALLRNLTVERGKFMEWEAIRLLDAFSRDGDSVAQEQVRADLMAIWMRLRDETTWGPYETGMLEFLGLPLVPPIMPTAREEGP